MSNYLSSFLTPRMLFFAGVVLVVAAGLTWIVRDRIGRHRHQMTFFALLVSVGAVLLVTLLREPPQGACPGCLGEWPVAKVIAGTVGTEVALNVGLFVPPVLLGTLLWRAPWRALVVGMLGSASIELVQPLLGVGANDAMDLVANTAGAVIGASAGAVALLVADLIRNRRFELVRTLQVVASLALASGLLFGYPAWAAGNKQSAGAAQLEQWFAGTKLADYQQDRDGSWGPKIVGFAKTNGPMTVAGYRTKTVARERFSWNVYFAERCVVAEWSKKGFSTVLQSGAACTATLQP